jgi:peptidoglycan/LPS O-acetylase OafA/YrhL
MRVRYPALDGVRGLAALGIVCDHSLPGMNGLGIGVDVFFVLSGFLITRLLLQEAVDTGGVKLRRFYTRRARRLLPALVLPLAVGVVLDATLAGGSVSAAASGLSTALYVQNWHLASLPGFPPDALNHTWSLSIEEQFYLVWPVLLMLVVRRRGSAGALGLCLAGIALVNADRVILSLAGASEMRISCGFDTRADQLLIGCLLAVLVQRAALPRVPGIAAAGAGMLLLVLGVHEAIGVHNTFPAPVAFPLVAVCAGVVIARLVQVPWSPLSSRPLRYLGTVSYGLYLWHHLAFWLFHVALGMPYGVLLFALVASSGLGLAALSYRWIESPILHGRPARGSTVPGEAAFSRMPSRNSIVTTARTADGRHGGS